MNFHRFSAVSATCSLLLFTSAASAQLGYYPSPGSYPPYGAARFGSSVFGSLQHDYGFGPDIAAHPNDYSYAPAGNGAPARSPYDSSYYQQGPYNLDTISPYAYMRDTQKGLMPAQTPAHPLAVHLWVHLPTPNAELWVQDAKTRQSGLDRHYTSPPLEPGQPFHYHLRAAWTENGQRRESTRTVTVQAGQHVTVNFAADTAKKPS